MTERTEIEILRERVFFGRKQIDTLIARIEILEDQINTQTLICNWLTILISITIFFNIVTLLSIFFK